MSVRKRTWKTAKGEAKETWVVRYVDQSGKWRLKTFDKKKDADAHEVNVKIAVRSGTHTPDSQSITVAQAGERWLKTGEANDLERATMADYRRHLEMHIRPYLGNVKLSKLTAPMVGDFRTKLREGTPPPGKDTGEPRSPAMVKKILVSLSSILSDAHGSGLVAQNVAGSLNNRKKKKTKAEQRRKLRTGIDIPTPDEIRAIVSTLQGRWRPLLLTAIFTGLRASELRGLRWSDVDLDKAELHVRQRADRYNKIDVPKSEAGERTVPLLSIVTGALREWKLACPKGPLGLVFPRGRTGHVEHHATIIMLGLIPAQIAAGVCTVKKDADGKVVLDDKGEPIREAKYTGLHALRHFFASWCINRKVDGGLELPAKMVQERLGHSSIGMTMDVYGHLFPRGDDKAELAEAEQVLLGPRHGRDTVGNM